MFVAIYDSVYEKDCWFRINSWHISFDLIWGAFINRLRRRKATCFLSHFLVDTISEWSIFIEEFYTFLLLFVHMERVLDFFFFVF